MAVRFYNTLGHRTQEFESIVPGEVKLYTCGPTVYNFAHIGNYRAYVFEDILRRTLKYCGYRVTQVMNLTDVDDKTIRDSGQAGVPLAEFTQKYKDAFFRDLAELRIEPAEFYPAATDHIPEMIDLIKVLVDKGIGYQADDGSVYFAIDKFPRYGQLVNIRREEMRPGERVRNDEYAKESVVDFALWKAYTPEDGDVAWDSPWGRGRPGWHIECSAMSMKYLGETFDIHTGGVDNMFPHHEDEIAQSEAANDCKFVNYWLHCAYLVVDGQKMSKSLGNFYTLRDVLRRGFSGREIRWVLMGTHYRQSVDFRFEGCDEARAALRRLDDFVLRLREAAPGAESGQEQATELVTRQNAKFRASLEDDLNVSGALAAVFDLVREGNKMLASGILSGTATEIFLEQLRAFDTVLGVLDVDREDDSVPADVLALVEGRQTARAERDFSRADTIRDQLKEQGWVVEDTSVGPRIKRL